MPAAPRAAVLCKFLTAAFVASRTNAIVTLPEAVSHIMASQLGMRVFAPPLRMPRIDVSQYWHERFHRDPGNRWIRNVFTTLFREE